MPRRPGLPSSTGLYHVFLRDNTGTEAALEGSASRSSISASELAL